MTTGKLRIDRFRAGTDRVITAAHRAVREVSLQLRRGEVLGLLGPNGAGKTTTMQMLTGNLAPTGGEVNICGIDLIDSRRRRSRASVTCPKCRRCIGNSRSTSTCASQDACTKSRKRAEPGGANAQAPLRARRHGQAG